MCPLLIERRNMIKNIIFDMGQVLIKFDPLYFIHRLGITDTKDTQILMREIYKSVEWSMMDRGSLTDAQACEIFKARVPNHLKRYVADLTCDWCKPLVPIDGAEELIRELKTNGYNMYLLSNASLNQKNYWNDIPGSDCFSDTVVSSYINLVKPQPEIFKYLVNKYELVPDECLFIDDATLNVEGAVYSGLHGIVFHGDYKEVREKMVALGINISLSK